MFWGHEVDFWESGQWAEAGKSGGRVLNLKVLTEKRFEKLTQRLAYFVNSKWIHSNNRYVAYCCYF